MKPPREHAAAAERAAEAPAGSGERFAGYGVMGLPFRSEHVLAMRRFPASSIGPGYTSVWHRDPAGTWTFYTDAEPLVSCNRYFGHEVDRVRITSIEVTWPSSETLRVSAGDSLVWESRLRSNPASRAMNLLAGLAPDALWTWTPALSLMGAVAGPMFRAGRLALHGLAPNGQRFVANPRLLWLIDDADATVGGEPLGAPGPLPVQAALGDFRIPQRGLFVIGRAVFERFDAERHLARATRGE